MAFDAGTARGQLDLDATGFVGAVTKATLAIGGLVVGAKAIGAAFSGVAKFITEGVQKQAEYEKSVVSLGNVLKNQGVRNFEAVTAEIEEFAGAMQRLTGVDDTVTLGVAQSLANLGVQAANLRPATKTVLDFSAAFGLNATRASRAFGQALAGNAAQLARYVPEVRNLTKEQLKAGAAFDLVAKKVEGQSEVIGNTFQGRLARLSASFDDFQKRIGEAFTGAFGPLVTEVQGVLDELTDRLGGGTQGFSALQLAAQAAAQAVRSGFEFAISAGLRVRETYLGVQAVILQFAASVNGFLAGFLTALGGAVEKIVGGLAGIANTMAAAAQAIGATGLADQLRAVADVASNISTTFAEAARNQQGVADALQNSADAATAAAVRSTQLRQEVESARANGASLAQQIGIVATRFGVTAEQAGKASRSLQEMTQVSRNAGTAAQSVLDLWKAVNETTAQTAGAVANTAEQTERAADAAADFASNMGDAASAASAAAGAASGAGGGAGGADAFGRRSGGSTSLDFSDPFRAVSLAQSAEAARRNVGANTFTGDTVRNAAAAFSRGVNAQTQAVVDRAIAEFTTQILQELNQNGVTDPSERNRIVRARIAEAKRFGILPNFNSRSQGSILGGF